MLKSMLAGALLATTTFTAASAQTAPAAAPAPAPAAASAAPAAPAPAAAATPVATPAPAPACELHIWPAARVVAVTEGAGAAFGLIGALIDASAHANQNKRDTAFITAALDAQQQARALKALDLPTLLHLPPAQVIVHDQGIDYKADQESPKRLADSNAACYYEFVVRGLSYFKSIAYAGQMRTFLAVRGFDGQKAIVEFHDSKHLDLAVKLPKDGEDTGPATDALIAAFKFDVTEFGGKFVRKTQKAS